MKLIRHDGPWVPGGHPFTDPKTGMKFPGMEADFNGQVRKIIQHRLANPAIYPPSDPAPLSVDHVTAELDKYQCDRLGNHRDYCWDGKSPNPRERDTASEGKCPTCGDATKERYCPTCQGQRVVGWTCSSCGKSWDK